MTSADNLAVTDNVEIDVQTCSGTIFFDIVANRLKTKIPVQLRNVLTINDLDRAIVFEKFTKETITELEHFMKNVFDADMLQAEETLEQYLGRYVKCQKKFMLTAGQKALIELIAETCVKANNLCTAPIVSNSTGLSNTDQIQTGVVDQQSHPLKDQNNATSLSYDEETFLSLKKKNLALLQRSMYKWIRNQGALNQLRDDELDFKVLRNTYERKPDNTITCVMECPISNCNKQCLLTYKDYRSYYKAKKKVNGTNAGWKWQLSHIEKHIKEKHFPGLVDLTDHTDGSNDDDQSASPPANQTNPAENRVDLTDHTDGSNDDDQSPSPPANQSNDQLSPTVINSNEDQNLLPPQHHTPNDDADPPIISAFNEPRSRCRTRNKHSVAVAQKPSKTRQFNQVEVQNKKSRKK